MLGFTISSYADPDIGSNANKKQAIAPAIQWWLAEQGVTKDYEVRTKKNKITEWRVSNVLEPTKEELKTICDNYDVWVAQQELTYEQTLASLRANLEQGKKLSTAEVDILLKGK